MRGYYFSDQRLINGQETTFAGEAGITTNYLEKLPWGDVIAHGEVLLTQDNGKNVIEAENNGSFTAYETKTFDISELFVGISGTSSTVKVGKTRSPFGRYYFPVFSNSRFDAPFIRTEAIIWRETGVFYSFVKTHFSLDIALTNGEKEQDMNSSKAGIARIGTGGRNWAFGVSAKQQDGTGSEHLKVYKNHLGADFMLRAGTSVIISGEFIYDEYGARQSFLRGVTGRTSLYYRDVYLTGDAITGIGGYLDVSYIKAKWLLNANYGEFHPEDIGIIYHDKPIRRGLLKAAYNITSRLRAFAVELKEANRPADPRRGKVVEHNAVMAGLQFYFDKTYTSTRDYLFR